MKIKSLAKLPKVDVKIMSDNIAWVFLYLNGAEVKETDEETGKTYFAYEYDFKEFHAPAKELDIEDIKANPDNYADYEPTTAATDLERIEAQVLYTASMTDTLLEE